LVTRLGVFLTWWGALILGALDSSLVFFMPFGIDAVVIYLAARDERLFWIYPLVATVGSVAGAAVTYWIGYKLGESGLNRLVPTGRLQRLRARVRKSGALALAIPALLPPPFPLTPFILTCGALQVSRRIFFSTFALMRLLRFSAGAALARVYGRGILRVAESDAFQIFIIGFMVIAVTGTIVSAVLVWRGTHARPVPAS
jgi:membrane protein YqaA with SNARE-associated domain